MVDIFDEVNEDLRTERVQALARRYGPLLVALVVLLIAGVAGWQVWRWKARETRGTVAASFIDAMRDSQAPAGGGNAPAREQALKQFDALAASAPAGYQSLARLRAAALEAAAGNLPAALAIWDKLSADTGADPLLRGLADLLWVQHQVDTGDPAAVRARLAQLTPPGNPWRAMARETEAWLDIRTGQVEQARTIMRELQADTNAPDGVRARAGALLGRLGETAPDVKGAGG